MQRLVHALVAAAALFGGGTAGQTPTTPGQAAREILRSGRDPDLRWPDLADLRATLDSVYARRGWTALWSGDGRPSAAARAFVQQLVGADQRGLDPSDYDAAWLDSATTAATRADPAPSSAELGRLDLALSVAAVRVADALHRGRVAPESLAAGLAFPRSGLDLPAWLDSLRSTARPAPLLDALEPRTPEYAALRRALVRYRVLAADTSLLPLPPFPRLMRPGDPWNGAPRLRRLLFALGDLPDSLAASGPADTLYGPDLVQGVLRFQRRHGLTADGVVGPVTAGQANRPLADRLRQIELALERQRWLPRTVPRRIIVVNLAAFELSARDGGALPAESLDLAVIVGEAEEHETPQFTAQLRKVVFQPWWEVPLSIMRNEVRPAALADAGYLARQGMELWIGEEVVPPLPEDVQRIGHGVRVRQRPGPANALGSVKFLLPNRYDVYLHDTPARSLFLSARRDFSHGCIRVSDATALARFVLGGLPGWTGERIEAAMTDDTSSTEVELVDPIPVYVLYQTAVPRPAGEIAFFSDLYGSDARLAARLRQGYPYRRIPE